MCETHRLLPFIFSDGNIASEDSSLSDALVLEDGRLSVSCFRTRAQSKQALGCVSPGTAGWKGKSQARVAAGCSVSPSSPALTCAVGSRWAQRPLMSVGIGVSSVALR